jgi:hypothetical protein
VDLRLILPKTFVEPSVIAGAPFFFLGGPIRGGGDWQHKMTLLLSDKTGGDCIIASPCRYTEEHPLWKYRMNGEEGKFPRQLDWERFYLNEAGIYRKRGCIIFWLGCESREHPHPGPEPYAMDTRGELGEWRGRMMHEVVAFVVGAEDGFSGLSQIQRNFTQALNYEFRIENSLEKTAQAAIERINLLY